VPFAPTAIDAREPSRPARELDTIAQPVRLSRAASAEGDAMAVEQYQANESRDDPDATRIVLRADPPSGLQRGTRLRDFEIESVIGEGGFSIVYAALDLNLRRRVALKEYMRRHWRAVAKAAPSSHERVATARSSTSAGEAFSTRPNYSRDSTIRPWSRCFSSGRKTARPIW